MNRPKLVPLRPRHATRPRGTTTARGYGHDHQKARARHLAVHPICQRCVNAFSTDLHHRDGNTSNRSPENLEALCEQCHHGEAHAGN